MIDIAVIGGGASGMMAAITAKRANPSVNIAIIERQSRVGRKLLATGNGRCNITNACCEQIEYYNSTFAGPVIARAGLSRVMEAFQLMGLEITFDEAGRAYPESNLAASAVDALRLTIEELSIDILAGREVKTLEKRGGAFIITCVDGDALRAGRVIVACGGAAGAKLGGSKSGYALLRMMGHRITPLYPALTQLKTDGVRGLKGIRRQCAVSLEIADEIIRREEGEVLFGDDCVSGIVVMQLSALAARALAAGKSVALVLRAAALSPGDIAERVRLIPDRRLEDFLSGVLPKRLGQTLLKCADIASLSRVASTLNDDEIARLSRVVCSWRLHVTGAFGFDSAQVTCGGADTSQFSDTLESRLVPGLYATGEVLDVHGDCGGFNLHWAWASGMVVGEDCSKGDVLSNRNASSGASRHLPQGEGFW